MGKLLIKKKITFRSALIGGYWGGEAKDKLTGSGAAYVIDLGSVFWLSLIGPEFKAKIKEVDCSGPVAADAMGQRSGYRPFVYSVFQDAHLDKIHSLPLISLAKETQLYTVYYRQRYNIQ